MEIEKMKLGPWQPGNKKPEATGLYRRKRPCGSIGWAYFDAAKGKWMQGRYEKARGEIRVFPFRSAALFQSQPWQAQVEYDPYLAPQGFVAQPDDKDERCTNCDARTEYVCPCQFPYSPTPCRAADRPDGRQVVMKFATNNFQPKAKQ